MDRLDEMNRKKSLQGNLIKWWNVCWQETTEDSEKTDTSLNEGQQELCREILTQNKHDDVYDRMIQKGYEEENGNE